MLIITKRLKSWAVANLGVDQEATDDDFKKSIGTALVEGELTTEKYAELIKDPSADEADEFTKRFDRLATGIENIVTLLKEDEEKETKTETKETETEIKETKTETKETETRTEQKETETSVSETEKPTRMAKMIGELGGLSEMTEEKTVDIRVKEAVEQYDSTRKSMTYPNTTKSGTPHPLAGQRVQDFGRSIDEPSQCDKALAGAWAKFQILSATPSLAGNTQRAWEKLSDHEKSLLGYLAEKSDWDDSKDNKMNTRKGYPGGIKALVDDGGASGALEAAPIVFDDQVITTPLLYGELYPLVTTKPLDRGRRVEGVETGTVTAQWGGVDDTSIDLFDTTSYISAFDTTIYRWEGSIRIGLDFLSDTPIDFGQHVTSQYGERLLEDLDDVIAVGNGTTQPEGIVNKSGVSLVAWGGATSIGNYESLRFGVAKAEHRPNVKNTAVFCGTETSYQRARALPVGASDARRLFGMDYDTYALMERAYKINESMNDTDVFYAILARYRMYRRKGLTIRTSTEGDTLIRRNEMLIVAMARYGGQLERAACAALTVTAPA